MEYQEFFDFINLLNNTNNNENLIYLQNLNNLNLNENQRNRRKYKVRNRIDPMVQYDEEEFERRFRFKKSEVNILYNLLDGRNTLEPLVSVKLFLWIANVSMK